PGSLRRSQRGPGQRRGVSLEHGHPRAEPRYPLQRAVSQHGQEAAREAGELAGAGEQRDAGSVISAAAWVILRRMSAKLPVALAAVALLCACANTSSTA